MTTEKKHKGFRAIDPQRQREIASMGGKTAHQLGTAHQFTSEEAREAGRKGGLKRAENIARRNAEAQAAAGKVKGATS